MRLFMSAPMMILIPLAILALLEPAARAADMETPSQIAAVTVYPDAAVIERTGEVDVPAGSTTVILRGLPANLDIGSLRAEASAPDAVSIGSVETRLTPSVERSGDTAIDAKLRTLKSEREGWQTTLNALEAKQAMIIRYSQASPEKLSDGDKSLDIGHWSAAWDAVGQGLAKIGDELRSARTQARDLDEQIHALEQNRSRPTLAPTRDAMIQLVSPTRTHISLRLSYRLGGVGWSPVYDARLQTGEHSQTNPSLEFVRRAIISQRTGENWSGISLTLSTVRASGMTSSPDLSPVRLTFWEPPAPLASSRAMAAPPAGLPSPSPAATKSADLAVAGRLPAQELEATLDTSDYQASFRVPGAVDVPGDGSSKTLTLASTTISPNLSIKSAPALDPTAYLQARFTNTESAPILPGQVNLTRDGVFIGTGHLSLVPTGDSVDLGFGADTQVTVKRTPLRQKENDPTWFGQTKMQQREWVSTIRNLHGFSVRVMVADRIPISENSAIVVEQLPSTTPPSDKIEPNRPGVLNWAFDLNPGASKDLRIAYRLKWPADRQIVEQPLVQ